MLFLTNLIKNYTTPCFSGICFIGQVQNKPRRGKMHHLERLLFAATDLAKQATRECKRLSRAASCGHPSLSVWKKRNISPAASLHAIVNYSKCSGHHKIRCLGGYSHYQSYLFNFLLQPALNSVFFPKISSNPWVSA